MKPIYRVCSVLILFSLASSVGMAQEDWMPDEHLRESVRKHLNLKNNDILTKNLMVNLLDFVVLESDIKNLQGLEHAINLRYLHISRSQIKDLSPLSKLTKLWSLTLYHNNIVDVSPISNLKNLEELVLHHNEITDFSPLLGLINLKVVLVHHNPGDGSQIVKLINNPDLTCVIERIDSFTDHIENRNYPSVFSTWSWDLSNKANLSREEQIAHHDLYFSQMFGMHWQYSVSDNASKLAGSLEEAKREREILLQHNPNMIFLASIYFYGARLDDFANDWPYWLRDTSGNPISDGEYAEHLIDFTQQGAQDLFVQQAIAIYECGLYDGIFLDLWHEERSVLFSRAGIEDIDGKYHKLEVDAKISMLKRIREAVGDDFLILINTIQSKAFRSAPYVNGAFMETEWEIENGAYTHQQLAQIEDTLLWSEQNFRSPQINCLEGYCIPTEPANSDINQRWMRVFTTLSLTHSDGYVLYSHEKDRIWYDFWDTDIGKPVNKKGQLYQNREGLFIREFDYGWAVYNRSGKPQEIRLPEQATGVESGLRNDLHILSDLDGEIYLKSTTDKHDVNSDGVVNIQDLVLVANAFGEAEPDLNGDDVVNIQDLVIVASAFGQ